MLNLPNRKSNTILNEIDMAVQSANTILTNNITTINESITDIDNGMTDIIDRVVVLETTGSGGTAEGIQFNEPFDELITTIKPWREDLLMYYDFSDKENIGRDITGNKRHLTPNNKIDTVNYVSDGTRTHTIEFKKKQRIVEVPNLFSNISHLDMSSYLPEMNLSSFTISFWVYKTADSAGPALLSVSDDTAPLLTHAVILRESTNRLRFVCYAFNVKICDIYFTDAMFEDNKWFHVCFATDATGNSLYGNGVKATQYVTAGSDTTHINLAGGGLFQPTNLTFGANQVYTASGAEKALRWDFSGKMSDISIWNRRLSDAEVTALYNDDYGYMCYILAGQSNMMGVGSTTTDPFDFDYSLHQGKVFQFNSETNFDVSGTLIATTISQATVNLKHFGMSAHPNSVGLWKTFCDDLMRYGNIPFRKKVLLIPVAQGSTGFIEHWSDGLPNYNNCRFASLAVLDDVYNVLNKMNTLHGFLWNQGEQSIRIDLDLNFQQNFIDMMEAFERDIPRFENIPVVFAETAGNFYDNFVSGVIHMKTFINNAYDELARNNYKWELVKTVGLVDFIADGKHLDIASYRKLGYMYYDAYCRAGGIPNRKPQENKTIVLNSEYGKTNIQITKPLQLMPTPYPYTKLSLDYHYSYNFNATASGAVAQNNVFFYLTKLGNTVYIQREANINFVATSNSNLLNFTAIPIEFRPDVTLNFIICGNPNFVGAPLSYTTQLLTINTTGIMSISNMGGSPNYTLTNSVRIAPFSITYQI